MSRVYEAMQRAASGSPAGGGVDIVESPVSLLEYPSESPASDVTGEGHTHTVVPQPTVVAESAPTIPAVRVVGVEGHAVTAAGTADAVARAEKGAPRPSFDRVAPRYEGKTLLDAAVSPQSREQYRRLAASLHQIQARQGVKVVMVTSALVGEGKTLTASNIALTLSQSYQKQVLLIDADLRRPSLQAVFGIKTEGGLTAGLTSSDDRPVQVYQVTPRLGILPAGRPTSDPIAVLTSDRMRQLVDEARSTFDWVILDTPPVTLITDANLVSAIADGTIVVVKAGHTAWDLVDRTVQAIGRERMLGVVLNHATTAAQGYGYYDDYEYYGGASSDSNR